MATKEDEQLSALSARVEALERERLEQARRSNAAIAAAQDRVYWLDRWHLDLNALMERPGAAEFRTAIRVGRAVYRFVRKLKQRLVGA